MSGTRPSTDPVRRLISSSVAVRFSRRSTATIAASICLAFLTLLPWGPVQPAKTVEDRAANLVFGVGLEFYVLAGSKLSIAAISPTTPVETRSSRLTLSGSLSWMRRAIRRTCGRFRVSTGRCSLEATVGADTYVIVAGLVRVTGAILYRVACPTPSGTFRRQAISWLGGCQAAATALLKVPPRKSPPGSQDR